MYRLNDSKGTPTKRTGVRNDNSPSDKEGDNDSNPIKTISPEIAQPNPTTATPAFPAEMPSREIK